MMAMREAAPGTTLELRGDREVVITRTFRAGARAVFEAWTRPELVSRWWAPRARGVEIVGCEAEVRPGGRWRYVARKGEHLVAFSGAYQEVEPPSRLVYTSLFEGAPQAGAALVTVTFEERAGATRLVAVERYPSAEVRDAVLASGMEEGMRNSLDQLDELVAGRAP